MCVFSSSISDKTVDPVVAGGYLAFAQKVHSVPLVKLSCFLGSKVVALCNIYIKICMEATTDNIQAICG